MGAPLLIGDQIPRLDHVLLFRQKVAPCIILAIPSCLGSSSKSWKLQAGELGQADPDKGAYTGSGLALRYGLSIGFQSSNQWMKRHRGKAEVQPSPSERRMT
jgi:hypothetical protein